eukprot:703311-Rhodomonas_salina.2
MSAPQNENERPQSEGFSSSFPRSVCKRCHGYRVWVMTRGGRWYQYRCDFVHTSGVNISVTPSSGKRLPLCAHATRCPILTCLAVLPVSDSQVQCLSPAWPDASPVGCVSSRVPCGVRR